MPELKTAITITEIIVGVGAALVIGDYLGYKIGRWRLAAIVGIVVLIAVIGFAIFAAITLI